MPQRSESLRSVIQAIWSETRFTLRCIACGDQFEVTYQMGCFGSLEIQTECIEQGTPWESALRFASPWRWQDRKILCAACGHPAWETPEQILLREADALKQHLERQLERVVIPLVHQAQTQREHAWADSLSIAHFRSLDPETFAALWEGRAHPNPKANLPRTDEKKIRYFLRQPKVQGRLAFLPSPPPLNPTVFEICRTHLAQEHEQIEVLKPSLQAVGDTYQLRFGTFVPVDVRISPRPDVAPSRGETEACYHLEPVSGRKRLQDLRALGRGQTLGSELIELREPVLQERLGRLLRAGRSPSATG